MACYLCYSQLRKCHNLMVRSVRAHEVLTHILRDGQLVNLEISSVKIRKIQQMNELHVTPVKLAFIPGREQIPSNVNVKEEPLSPQRKEEINTDRGRCADYLKFEESQYEEDIERVVLGSVANIENDDHLVQEKINKQLGDKVDIESDDLTGLGYIKQEKLEVTETNWGRCVSYLMFENSEGKDNERNDLSELIREEDRSHNEPLSPLHNKVTNTPICMDNLKFENSEHEEFEHDTENMKVTGAASAEECKKTHADKIQDVRALTYGKNVLEKRKTRRTVIKEEATNRGCNSNMLRSTKKPANNRQVSINRRNVSINNECASTSRDLEHRICKQLNKMFACDNCSSMFNDKYLLIDHIERHNVVKKERNQENFHQHMTLRKLRPNRTGNVIRNIETQSAEIVFQCEVCLRRFTKKEALKKHSITHTSEKPFECKICKIKLRWKGDLKRHLTTHTGEKRFECHICNVRFNRKYHLKAHLITHTDEKPFECEVCKIGFRTKFHLKSHLILHTGEKPFECEICNVRFGRKSDLKQHTVTHTGEKHFECDICKLRFSQSGHLKIHSMIHTGQKPFECEICKVRFIRKDHLRRHLMTHTGEKPFECDICQARFSEKGPLKKHLMTHTGEKPFECHICRARFRHKFGLRTHFIRHTGEKLFECEICKIRLSTKGGLKKHLMIHTGQKPFECEICKFRFIDNSHLKRHLVTHTGKKPFECDICTVRFTRKIDLKSHLITHAGE